VHVYRCRITEGIPAVPPTGEIAEIGWFDPGLLPAPVTNILDRALPDAVVGRRDVLRTDLPRLN
jgi:hypothetical protein